MPLGFTVGPRSSIMEKGKQKVGLDSDADLARPCVASQECIWIIIRFNLEKLLPLTAAPLALG